MGTLLLRHADHLVTMDDQRREIADGAVLIEDQRIVAAGPSAELPDSADEVIDCQGMLLLPGLINTHHHLYQTLTRAMPGGQDAELFGWLKTLYPIWSRLRGEDIYISAKLGLTELLLSGCTTSSDHLYIYPNDARIDDEIRAAQELGIRFHAARGSMSVGESQGGLPPDSVVEDEQAILHDTRRVIEQYHDAAPYAMLQVVVAPCSPFSVSQNLMREAAALARSYGVRLHTHLAENANDVTYSLERFGQTPGDYAESVGWVGPDVVARPLRQDRRPRDRAVWAHPDGHLPLPILEYAAGIGHRASGSHAEARRCLSASGSMAAPRTTAATCWPRRVWPCCSSAWAATRRRSPPARRSSWPRAAARRCWAATTSAAWRPARPPTLSAGASIGWPTPAPCTTRSRR